MKKSNKSLAIFTLILLAVSTNAISTAAYAQADHLEKALVLKRSGNLKGALEEFEKALRKDPNDNVALIDRALMRFDSLGDRQGGFDDINQALNVNMIDAVALRTRADFKSETGDTAGALADYREALKWRPNDALSYANRGILYEQIGKNGLALSDFSRAIALSNDLTAQFNRIRLLTDKNAAL
ncbi:MAG: tetratricopeptide repeat protein, partial [Cyanobacteria bacterium SZAS LIN-5]|nr:tetratricopeptide repeat protein [Cyanobacteria bacterium SZAS LIN-5]